MKHNWHKSLEVMLRHEGGYVNLPKDPGGETNMGVTKRVYEEHGGTKDMKELTHEDVNPIYKKGYWDKVKGDDLPDGVSAGDNKLDDDGKTIPVMQGIDQSKLVPLLTAALQEAIAKIETLETKVTALEGE